MRKRSSMIIEAIENSIFYGFFAMLFFICGLCAQTSVNEAIAESCMPSFIEKCIPIIMWIAGMLTITYGFVHVVKIIVNWYRQNKRIGRKNS